RPLDGPPGWGRLGGRTQGRRREAVVRGTDDRDFAAFVRDAGPGLATAAWVLTGHAATAESLAREALARLHPRWSRVRHRPVAAAEQALVEVYAGRRAAPGAPPPAKAGQDGQEQDQDELHQEARPPR